MMNTRNLKLTKRLLSMSLALSMCLGMACTTAFAEDNKREDWVYVYVNVDTATVEEPEDPPEFKPSIEAPDDTKLTNAESKVDNAKEEIPDEKPTFDADGTLQGAVDSAVKDVNETLEILQGTDKPTYPSETDTDTDADADTAEAAEAQDPSFADQVNDAVADLNKEQKTTDDAATEDVKKANDALDDLKGSIADVDEERDTAKTALDQAKKAAQSQIDSANEAIKACEEKKTALENDLNEQLKSLEETKPSASAPERQEGQSEADYVAEYNSWVEACQKYNTNLGNIQSKYDEAVAALAEQTNAAKEAVEKAEAAFAEAQQKLTDYETVADKYDGLQDSAGSIQEIHDKLDNYNKDVTESDYNSAAEKYNDAAENYNDKVGEYNGAAGIFNSSDDVKKYDKAIGDYNSAVDAYNEAGAAYDNKAAVTYNNDVNSFNKTAANWNTDKASSQTDMLKSELEKAGLKDIAAVKETLANVPDPWENIPADEYNAKVEEYNKTVTAYNQAVENFNKKLTEQGADGVIKDVVNAYFKDEQIWTREDEGTHWYTLGKINVKGSEFADWIGDYAEGYMGYGDVYTWTVDGNDVDGEAVDGRLPSGAPFNGFEEKLANGAETFVQDELAQNECKDLMKNNINKWVLTVAPGANDAKGHYYIEGGPTWHLNGYLKVTQMSKLATLEKRVAVFEEKEHKTKASVDPIPDTELKTVNLYEERKPEKLDVSITSPSEETLDLTMPVMNDFQLNVTVPGKLTEEKPLTPPSTPIITPPTTPPTGGDDETGGGEDDPPVIIDDEDVPLVDVPVVDVPEEDVPLVDVPEEDVPLVQIPEEVDILDEDVPLAAVPKTGDISGIWYAITLMSACALAALTLRKKECDD